MNGERRGTAAGDTMELRLGGIVTLEHGAGPAKLTFFYLAGRPLFG